MVYTPTESGHHLEAIGQCRIFHSLLQTAPPKRGRGGGSPALAAQHRRLWSRGRGTCALGRAPDPGTSGAHVLETKGVHTLDLVLDLERREGPAHDHVRGREMRGGRDPGRKDASAPDHILDAETNDVLVQKRRGDLDLIPDPEKRGGRAPTVQSEGGGPAGIAAIGTTAGLIRARNAPKTGGTVDLDRARGPKTERDPGPGHDPGRERKESFLRRTLI